MSGWSKSGILLPAALLGVALAAWGLREATQPTVLRLAVGPIGSDDARLAGAIARQLDERQAQVRLKIVRTTDLKGAASEIESRNSDLAIVRSDVAYPPSAGTVLVTHRAPLLLLARPGSKIKNTGDLGGTRIGVAPGEPADLSLMSILARQAGLAPDTISLVPMPSSELATALKAKRIDVAALLASPNSAEAQQLVSAIAAPSGPPPVFVEIGSVDAVAQGYPVYEKATIQDGAFRADPPRPADQISTLSVSYRLVARPEVPETLVASLARSVFAMRIALLPEAPQAAEMTTPDTEKGAHFPLHAGASDFYADEEKSFMDRYGDWFYLGAMVSGGLGSVLAALFGSWRARRRRTALTIIDELVAVADEARQVCATEGFDQALDRIAILSNRGLRLAREGYFDSSGMQALRFAIDESREAVERRRRTFGRDPKRLEAVNTVTRTDAFRR